MRKGVINLTIQQQAYNLIDILPDDSVRVIIEIMNRMPKLEKTNTVSNQMKTDYVKTRKMVAFEKMQELRKEMIRYNLEDFDAEREKAMQEKYGVFM